MDWNLGKPSLEQLITYSIIFSSFCVLDSKKDFFFSSMTDCGANTQDYPRDFYLFFKYSLKNISLKYNYLKNKYTNIIFFIISFIFALNSFFFFLKDKFIFCTEFVFSKHEFCFYLKTFYIKFVFWKNEFIYIELIFWKTSSLLH